MRRVRWLGLGLLLVLLAPSALRADDQRASDRRVAFGEVMRATADDRQLVVRTRDGKEMTFHVDGKTRLRVRGMDRLSRLEKGTPVRVRYVVADDRNRAIAVVVDPLIGPEVRQEVMAFLLERAKEYAFQQKDVYRRKLDRVVDDLDDRIDELEARVETAPGEKKPQYERQLGELKQKRAEVKQRMEKVDMATAAAWEELRTGVGSAVDELQKAVQRAEAEIKKAESPAVPPKEPKAVPPKDPR